MDMSRTCSTSKSLILKREKSSAASAAFKLRFFRVDNKGVALSLGREIVILRVDFLTVEEATGIGLLALAGVAGI